MTISTDTNPYAPPSTVSKTPIPTSVAGGNTWLRTFCLAHCGIMLVALGAEFYDIESILGSGPIFFVAGTCLAILGYRRSDVHMAILGASAPAFAVFVCVLINVMDWGPSDATIPVIVLSCAYTTLTLPLTLYLLATRSRSAERAEETSWLTKREESLAGSD